MIPASYIKSSSLIALQLPVATQTLDSISIVLQCLRDFGARSIHFSSRSGACKRITATVTLS
jgi:hypothetical protein